MLMFARVGVITAWLVFALAWPSHASEGFRGQFHLEEIPGSALKRLKHDFGYVDPYGIGWEAPANMQTDGASIPLLAQVLVGTPFRPEYIKSSVIHDRYCHHRVRTWEATHRMFYNALISEGVPRNKALSMYYGVLSFGPKWQLEDISQVRLRCRVAGENCVRSLGDGDVRVKAERAATYDNPDIAARLKWLEGEIEAGRVMPDPASIQALARAEEPHDWFHRQPAIIDGDGRDLTR